MSGSGIIQCPLCQLVVVDYVILRCSPSNHCLCRKCYHKHCKSGYLYQETLKDALATERMRVDIQTEILQAVSPCSPPARLTSFQCPICSQVSEVSFASHNVEFLLFIVHISQDKPAECHENLVCSSCDKLAVLKCDCHCSQCSLLSCDSCKLLASRLHEKLLGVCSVFVALPKTQATKAVPKCLEHGLPWSLFCVVCKIPICTACLQTG